MPEIVRRVERGFDTFYIGCYLAEEINKPFDGDNWCLPGLPDIKETSNVEELLADPEDFNLLPLEAQAGCETWSISFDTAGEFYADVVEFYGSFYLGAIGKGRDPQQFPIAISDFYQDILEDC